jgi:hypothetical protein
MVIVSSAQLYNFGTWYKSYMLLHAFMDPSIKSKPQGCSPFAPGTRGNHVHYAGPLGARRDCSQYKCWNCQHIDRSKWACKELKYAPVNIINSMCAHDYEVASHTNCGSMDYVSI